MRASEPFFGSMDPSKREEILRLEITQQEALVLELTGKLSRIRMLHPNVVGWCIKCGDIWPCPTVKIIDEPRK